MASTAVSKKIVVLDDEPSVLFALKLLIQTTGYIVFDFTDAEAAMLFAEQEKELHCFLSDLKMNPINGFDVAGRIRKSCPNLPFIMMSGHAQDEEIAYAKTLGVECFLLKPFSPAELLQAIALLNDRSLNSAA